MKKSKAIVILLVLVLLLGGLGYTAAVGVGSEHKASASDIKLGLDLAGGVSITYKVAGDEKPSAEDMADTIYKLQKRVETYSTESVVYQEGDDRINIEIPGVSDANAILEELGKPGSLYFISETDSEGNYNYQASMDANGNIVYVMLKSIDEIIADGSAPLSGTDVKDAQAGSITNSMGNTEIGVDLTMTDEGTQKFADATTRAYQKGETLGIYYDGNIISAPSVKAALTDGKAQITGNFTYEEAEQLASTIRIGGLKLELEELHSKVVGAQLGEEAISTSVKAGAVGFAIIVIFMIAVYYISGLAASLALGLYVEMIIILLNGFEITLTLPGIAGIILSIGMAVDANVIIFARIREELAKGKTVRSAIDTGFKKAQSAILDGNITTLIAAGVLWLMGSGTVKGFAETLALGIALSMFTAMVITKLILKAFYALGLQNAKLYGVAKERKSIRFTSKKAVFFGISAAAILAGFVFMGVNKAQTGNILNYSLEFIGGTSTSVTFNEDLSLADIDAKVVPLIENITGDGNVQTQKIDGTNEVIFKTRTLSVEERESFKDAMVDHFSVDAEKITAETISSTISNEMKQESIIAVLVATICMLIYVWFRFKDVRFGASSVLCLLHDVLVVLAFYAIVKVSVGTTFIACMLTIVGYSINATIVIFDRVRENMTSMTRKDSLSDMVDTSITQTLSRSIFTSLTTFIMVAALYVFGVTSVKEFALPLMAGILCGTYSSVCVAGALWLVLRKVFPAKAQ
ncbi:MAG: protein translocase subunit SecD [Lachnospiraceae bacterium]|nr:protein translocase subunit SecD [Lachnospiraceae bacterium]MDD7627057.1 protein translocase subunit SecD [Lachnospiraceae bacterium]MDY4118944.1 protein translocase subunit SecD [Lachnospiraceae bacterium]